MYCLCFFIHYNRVVKECSRFLEILSRAFISIGGEAMIGVIAAFFTTLSFIPQAWQVIKTKDTSSISLGMYSMFVVGVFLWTLHGWNLQDYAIIGANGITFILASIILAYKIKYK